MKFEHFAQKVEQRFRGMASDRLYVVDIEPDLVWDEYMKAFPEGTNEIYRERREYDCSCCKSFIRRIGNVVAIDSKGKLTSVWDVETEGYYQTVTDALSKFVKAAEIKTVFLSQEPKAGAKTTRELLESGAVKTWTHFHCDIPSEMVDRDMATKLGKINSDKQVFGRGLREITREAIEIVIELIDQKSIYRGDEFKQSVESFLKLKIGFDKAKDKEIYIWSNLNRDASRLRNTAIGTLLQDISEGIELTAAVKSFEAKVAPTNYKRTTSLITKGMIDDATKTIGELGIEDSLHRRYAHVDDISINNVLFVDKSLTPLMKDSLTDLLMKDVKTSNKTFDTVDEINIDDFIRTILPKSETVEVLFENKHVPNLMSLVAPKYASSPNILKWNNNFTWSYNGDITDSMKERVKSAGGNVTGELRFSIQWNENMNDTNNDLDAHCNGPTGHIYYSNKNDSCTGSLDVDIQRPQNNIAVENITWQDRRIMLDGVYKFYVNNYSGRNTDGFRAEIEFDGKTHSFSYDRPVTSNVEVAEVRLHKGEFIIKTKLDSSESSREEWGISTNIFQKVKTIMYSPNHWDDNEVGNKHFMFMLDGCENEGSTRGLYNEFLSNTLTKHRKVFEVLGSKLKCEYDDNQLSGLGFSSTVKNELIVKVTGTFNRTVKIKF